jgi:Tfp pilus assembly protein PilP
VLDATPEIRTAFKLKGIMKGRRGNMALVNTSVVRVGDDLPAGGTITRITDTEVHLRVRGTEYRMIYSP